MDDDHGDLDRLQSAYKAAVDAWVDTIRAEEALASVNHTVAQVDTWEAAYFASEKARHATEAAKKAYEAGLRARFYNIT